LKDARAYDMSARDLVMSFVDGYLIVVLSAVTIVVGVIIVGLGVLLYRRKTKTISKAGQPMPT